MRSVMSSGDLHETFGKISEASASVPLRATIDGVIPPWVRAVVSTDDLHLAGAKVEQAAAEAAAAAPPTPSQTLLLRTARMCMQDDQIGNELNGLPTPNLDCGRGAEWAAREALITVEPNLRSFIPQALSASQMTHRHAFGRRYDPATANASAAFGGGRDPVTAASAAAYDGGGASSATTMTRSSSCVSAPPCSGLSPSNLIFATTTMTMARPAMPMREEENEQDDNARAPLASGGGGDENGVGRHLRRRFTGPADEEVLYRTTPVLDPRELLLAPLPDRSSAAALSQRTPSHSAMYGDGGSFGGGRGGALEPEAANTAATSGAPPPTRSEYAKRPREAETSSRSPTAAPHHHQPHMVHWQSHQSLAPPPAAATLANQHFALEAAARSAGSSGDAPRAEHVVAVDARLRALEGNVSALHDELRGVAATVASNHDELLGALGQVMLLLRNGGGSATAI